MYSSQYSTQWLTDKGEIIDYSNNIIYTNVNRLKSTYFKSFVDISGDLVVRSGKIYNDNLASLFDNINNTIFTYNTISGITYTNSNFNNYLTNSSYNSNIVNYLSISGYNYNIQNYVTKNGLNNINNTLFTYITISGITYTTSNLNNYVTISSYLYYNTQNYQTISGLTNSITNINNLLYSYITISGITYTSNNLNNYMTISSYLYYNIQNYQTISGLANSITNINNLLYSYITISGITYTTSNFNNYLTLSGFNYNIQNYAYSNSNYLTISGFKVAVSNITPTIFNYLTGLTSNVQNQISSCVSVTYLQTYYTTTANLNSYLSSLNFTGYPTMTSSILPVSDQTFTLATNKWVQNVLSAYLSSYALTITLNNYVLTTVLNTVVNNISTNYLTISGFNYNIQNYHTVSDYNNNIVNYLTISGFNFNIQNYVTNSTLNSTVNNIATNYLTISGFSYNIQNYVTTTALNTSLSTYSQYNTLSSFVTTTNLNNALNNYTTTTNLANFVFTGKPSISGVILSTTDNTNKIASCQWVQSVLSTYSLNSVTISNYVTNSYLTTTLGSYQPLISTSTTINCGALNVNGDMVSYKNLYLGNTTNSYYSNIFTYQDGNTYFDNFQNGGTFWFRQYLTGIGITYLFGVNSTNISVGVPFSGNVAFSGNPKITSTILATTDNTQNIATTAWVKSLGYTTTNMSSFVFTGNPTITSTILATTDNSNNIPTTAWVKSLGYLTSSNISSTYATISNLISINTNITNLQNNTTAITYNSGLTQTILAQNVQILGSGGGLTFQTSGGSQTIQWLNASSFAIGLVYASVLDNYLHFTAPNANTTGIIIETMNSGASLTLKSNSIVLNGSISTNNNNFITGSGFIICNSLTLPLGDVQTQITTANTKATALTYNSVSLTTTFANNLIFSGTFQTPLGTILNSTNDVVDTQTNSQYIYGTKVFANGFTTPMHTTINTTNNVVDTTNTQVVSGQKTFSTVLITPKGTTLNTTNDVVDTTNAQTIAGVKTFSSGITLGANQNITLATTFTTPTSLQLGYTVNAIGTAPQTIGNGTLTTICSMTVTAGVWNFYYGMTDLQALSATTAWNMSNSQMGLSTSGLAMSVGSMFWNSLYSTKETISFPAGVASGCNIYQNYIATFTATTTIYLLVNITSNTTLQIYSGGIIRATRIA